MTQTMTQNDVQIFKTLHFITFPFIAENPVNIAFVELFVQCLRGIEVELFRVSSRQKPQQTLRLFRVPNLNRALPLHRTRSELRCSFSKACHGQPSWKPSRNTTKSPSKCTRVWRALRSIAPRCATPSRPRRSMSYGKPHHATRARTSGWCRSQAKAFAQGRRLCILQRWRPKRPLQHRLQRRKRHQPLQHPRRPAPNPLHEQGGHRRRSRMGRGSGPQPECGAT